MPQVINRQSTDDRKKTVTTEKAVVKQRDSSRDGPPEVSRNILIAAGVITILFIALLIHLYVSPFSSPAQKIERVPPLPGFADQPPYNTKEWQEAYKAGRATPMSGVPRGPAAEALSRQ